MGLAQANGDPMEAVLVLVPEVKARGSVPRQEIRRHSECGRLDGAAAGSGGGREDGVVLERKPIHFVFRRGGRRCRH